jgi:integrase/recombinase XerD
MIKHNANNERIKRQFFAYLKEAKRQSEDSVDAAASALARFETYTGRRDFKGFHYEQAIAFKRHLAEQRSQASGKPLSKATLKATLAHLKRFFFWLADQPGYKSKLNYSDSDYFNLSQKDARVANARRSRPVPTLEQVLHTLEQMPSVTDIDRRNRALLAFALLTGARDSAIASFKLKHIDLEMGSVFQDAREVKTKFSKTFTTYFFPVGDWVQEILADWVRHLRVVNLWGNDDPLFPSTKMVLDDAGQFTAAGLKREHWSDAGPIRTIYRDAFERAGLQYFNPHSLRSTLVRLGETLCKTPEAFKAWSQNLGHESVLTTFTSYGSVAGDRQAEIFRKFTPDGAPEAVDGPTYRAFMKALQDAGVASVSRTMK